MTSLPGRHLDDQQLTDAYYGDKTSEHLLACEECRGKLQQLREVLDAFNRYPIPQRGPEHGSEMWTRVLPHLPPDQPKRRWLRWWTLTPALAALLLLTFMTGRLAERTHSAGISDKSRERVLLFSLSDHLQQSQIVLANVAHARGEAADLADERDRAHELLGANRLLRQTAVRLGDFTDAALLDELERVLLDVANSRVGLTTDDHDLARTQQQIEQQGLLFRVRVTSIASRQRGEKL